MRLIKVKKVKKIIWHNIADLYDYYTKIKEPRFIVELDEDEYMRLIQKEDKYREYVREKSS